MSQDNRSVEKRFVLGIHFWSLQNYLINENDHFEVAERHHKHVMKLQRTAFRYFKETMSDFALLNVGNVDTRGALLKQFSKMRFILSSISLIFVSAKKSFIGLQNVLI